MPIEQSNLPLQVLVLALALELLEELGVESAAVGSKDSRFLISLSCLLDDDEVIMRSSTFISLPVSVLVLDCIFTGSNVNYNTCVGGDRPHGLYYHR